MTDWELAVCFGLGCGAFALLLHIGKKMDEVVLALKAIERAVSGPGR